MQQKSENQHQSDWPTLIAEQEKSGLSQKEFCNQRGLLLSQFVYQRCYKNKRKSTQVAVPELKPVKISEKEPSASSGDVRLSLPNGFQCSFSCCIDVIQIKRLVEVLLSC